MPVTDAEYAVAVTLISLQKQVFISISQNIWTHLPLQKVLLIFIVRL